ncbi:MULTISPECIES: helix-turn-helix transcriptional regulator [Streptomyces]|uniref:Helix-turn-helix domain-containing protein n=1 Tax=Streptomyces koelreuteriae TaxID=2838015 RepID=A0ABX8FXU7_9ACTN|nr:MULTISPECIES: helix-turn-helix transcriptional regulator [Streptomyces]QWB25893.1 helix-turn-helix domain-containing protein [Streptomyces koelreuteriae]UUA08955.1 helix-turn-helix domain-containing protein [Streptomyces koelreuteriae]UUA16560.1 helix-turn-helix domain-containing protein [Streptomyces sp. CRCS-T-1]
MSVSPSSSAQAAREAVARRLRELRKEAGLTIVQLAAACRWHHSKTSRVENALQSPTTTDIRLWCSATGATDQVQDLIVQSLNAESMYREWRHQVRAGLKHLQDSVAQFYRDTQLFRVYSSTIVPGLLQTEGYATAVLRAAARFRDLPTDDSAEAARARVERSRVIYEQGHRFVIVLEEAVLHCQMADADAMAAQLGNLLSAGALPAVSLGIIPMAAGERRQWPEETFQVYDDQMVSVELVSAEVKVTQPCEVALYLKTFEQLRAMAVYGAEARALILRAIEALH